METIQHQYFKRIRPADAFLLCIFMMFISYELVAYINSYVIDLKGASVDAEKFQTMALEWAQKPEYKFDISVGFYVQLLGTVYLLFGDNEFFASQISVFALLFSALKLHGFLNSQGVRHNALIILVILMWPSLIPRGGTTLREPLIILATIYFVIELTIFFQDQRKRNMIKAVLSGFVLFLLHKATGLMSLAILVASGVYFVWGINASVLKKLAFIFASGTLMSIVLAIILSNSDLREMRVLVSVLGGDVEGMESMLGSKYDIDARARYEAPILFDSPLSFVFSVFRSVFYYMFQPFPTRVQTIFDVYAFLEVVIRGYLFFYIILNWRKMHRSYRFAFISYMIITAVWAVGTTNYGTASRHHLMNFWILVVLYTIIREQKQKQKHMYKLNLKYLVVV